MTMTMCRSSAATVSMVVLTPTLTDADGSLCKLSERGPVSNQIRMYFFQHIPSVQQNRLEVEFGLEIKFRARLSTPQRRALVGFGLGLELRLHPPTKKQDLLARSLARSLYDNTVHTYLSNHMTISTANGCNGGGNFVTA